MYIHDVLHKTPLITYSTYYKESKKKNKENPFNVENWRYLQEQDEYICPAKRPVPFKGYSRRKDKGGFVRDFKVYECEDCRACPIRSQCTRSKSAKKRQLLVNNFWRYFKAECKKKLLEAKNQFDLSSTKSRCRTSVWSSKGSLSVPSFSLTRGARNDD